MSSKKIKITVRAAALAASLVLLTVPLTSQVSANLPDSPRPQPQATQPVSPSGTGTIAGTVIDTNGDVIQGATVQLSKAGAGAVRKAKSSGTGAFEFSGLDAGVYSVSVTGKGMRAFVSGQINVGAEQVITVPNVVLSVAGATTSVTVLDQSQASIEQMHIAEKQRVFGVFPNFYSSYDWNAPSMMPREKYHLALRTLFDPVTFATVAGVAGAEQYKNIFPSFGPGFEGYGKRYITVYANHVSSEILSRAVYPSIFHDDPRYFVLGKGSTRNRAFHAVSSTFVTRGDNGSRKVNYSEILGELTSAALSNAYYPQQERGAHLVFVNGLGDIAGDVLDNLVREFVLNHLTSRAHPRP